MAFLEAGYVIDGKYRVDRVLGWGGMGVVLLARHLQLDEPVAIKLPLPALLESRESVERFLREGRAAVKIKSEHVARVTDVGRLGSGEPYIVMEYLEGENLATWLRTRGILPVELAVEFVLQALEAIAEAHALGIIHRDLKPANLFCLKRTDGLLSIKVLDFGISKQAIYGAAGHTGITSPGEMIGTPSYMSPEQVLSARDVDVRSDIWALGVILYELLSGSLPFVADSLPNLATRILREHPAALRGLRPDVPQGLDQVVSRCLQKQADHRYSSVAELARALGEFAPKRARNSVERVERVIESAGISAVTIPATDPPQLAFEGWAPSGRLSDRTATTWAASEATPLRPRRRLLVTGAGILLIGMSAGIWALSARSPATVTKGSEATPTAPPSSPTAAPKQAASKEAVSNYVEKQQEGQATPPSPAPSQQSGSMLDPLPSSGPTNKRSKASGPARKVRAPVNPSPSPKSGCDPNFYFDAQGEKHFKAECF